MIFQLGIKVGWPSINCKPVGFPGLGIQNVKETQNNALQGPQDHAAQWFMGSQMTIYIIHNIILKITYIIITSVTINKPPAVIRTPIFNLVFVK